MTPIAPHACAVCGDDIWESPPRTAQLGIDDSFVPICERCDTETPRELRGPERAYEGAGAPLTAKEMTAGARRVMGDDYYERENERIHEVGRKPAPPANPDDVIFNQVRHESVRLQRVYKGHTERISARETARRDVARKVKRRPSRS